MSRVSPHPNFIIIGGDIPAHGLTDPKAALDAFRGTLKTTANTFRGCYFFQPTSYILGVPVILTLGNNDFFPRYSINTPMQPWLATLATEILEPLNIFPTQQSNSDFRNNGEESIMNSLAKSARLLLHCYGRIQLENTFCEYGYEVLWLFYSRAELCSLLITKPIPLLPTNKTNTSPGSPTS